MAPLRGESVENSLEDQVRLVLRWSAAAGLAFLGAWSMVLARSFTGGGSLPFLIAAAIMMPPVHARWKRSTSWPPFVVVVPLFVIGMALLAHASEERADEVARSAGWMSAADGRRALKAGFTTPDAWAPRRAALDAEEARRRAEREEADRQVRAAEAEAKRLKEAECRATLRCWAERTIITASLMCREPVERLPRFSFRWVDKWYEPKFSHYRWASLDKGTVTYIGDRMEIQNVFGAWVPHIYECDYDPETKQVLAVRAQPGRL
jgi:hypothetical protein